MYVTQLVWVMGPDTNKVSEMAQDELPQYIAQLLGQVPGPAVLYMGEWAKSTVMV